jgi:hypothetical protein
VADEAPLPVIASVRAAFSFFTQHWRRFALAAALPVPFLFGAWLQSANVVNSAGLLAVATIAAIPYRAAMFRFALRGEYDGVSGLRLGKDEGRLAIVAFLYGLFLMLVFVVALAPLAVLVLGVTAASGDPAALEAAAGDSAAVLAAMGSTGRTIFSVGWALIVCLMLFVGFRLILAAPATIAEGRIVFLKSWPWTKGSFFRLLAAVALATLPGIAAQAVLMSLAVAVGQSAALLAILVVAALYAGSLIGGMMGAGVLAFIYRGLRPPA